MRHFTIAVAATDVGDDRRQWIEVMPVAEKARNGRFFFTITAEDLEVFAEYIRANPDQISIDYDHEGAQGGSTAAAGWFTGQAEVREGEKGPVLMAEVEWTPQGLEDVRSKRFRFISPEWEMAERDEKTGLMTKAKAFLAATLTNRPFFRQELAPVASQEDDDPNDPGEEPAEEENMDAVRAALGLPEDATEEQILAAAKAAKEASDRLAAAKTRGTRGKEATTVNEAIKAALGLPTDADEATVIATAQSMREDSDRLSDMSTEFGTMAAKAAEAAKLEERIKVLEAKGKQSEVARILDDGVRRGKVAPVEKTVLAKQYASNPEGLEELLAARPENLFRLAPIGTGGDVDLGEDVVSVATKFESAEADGIDVDSARLHAAAIKLLREEGVSDPTDVQYARALERVAS